MKEYCPQVGIGSRRFPINPTVFCKVYSEKGMPDDETTYKPTTGFVVGASDIRDLSALEGLRIYS